MAFGWPEDHLGQGNFWRAVLAEFVATMLLVMVGCGSVISFDEVPFSVERIALAFGLAIAALVQATGNISGGHINPAVTFAMLSCRKIGFLRAAFYIKAQVAGGLMGAILLYAITPEAHRGNLGSNGLSNGLSAGQGFGCEFFLTFMLVLVIFAATDEEGGAGAFTPLTIGLTVAVAHLMGVPFSGASMNPARSFGPAVVSNTFADHWIYWFGPLLAGPVAGFLYLNVFKLKKEPSKIETQNTDEEQGHKSAELEAKSRSSPAVTPRPKNYQRPNARRPPVMPPLAANIQV